MRRVIRALFLFLPALAAFTAETSADRMRAVETGLRPPRVVKGRPMPRYSLEERMRTYKVKGVSIAVIDGYKIDWAKGYGLADVESNRPVTAETLFQAGSISKPVAAVGAMKLVEGGKLNLDADVNTWLKSWRVPENDFTREQKVTLRRIMSHSAGLTVHGFPGYEAGKPVPSVPEVLDGKPPANTAAIRVDTIPGTQWRYSGGGYTIMQLLLTDVTGRPFPALLKDLVLKPAGMSRSSYEQPPLAERAAASATGYDRDGNAVAGRFHIYPEMAAAGLWTTASDLALFAIEMQKSREGRSNRILSKETVEEMLREQMKPYGLGFALDEKQGLRRFGHNGADEGFQALLTATFDGRGVAIMANSDNGLRLMPEVALAVAEVYNWPDKPEEREAVSLTPKQLSRFAGSYETPQVGLVTVGVEGDHVRVKASRMGEVVMYPASDSRLFSIEAGIPDFNFTMPSDGGAATEFRGGGVHGQRAK
jgi:CubicO group peptidase (beta-lactamase class C family)